ncbi:MAG: hypothetical protein LC648_02455 [Novosphingobium sp.]|nr:hypothetical protein [Novosphingobium sp.]
MIASPASLRRIGWASLLGLCCAVLLGLSLKVNALKAEVRQAENRILALKRETLYLETEFETRSNQQQLAAWNAVDFGYQAPSAGQYFENARQLAALGQPAGPGAPKPIRVAAVPSAAPALTALVSPPSGKPLGEEEEPADASVDHDAAAAALGERLGKVERAEPVPEPKAAAEAEPRR